MLEFIEGAEDKVKAIKWESLGLAVLGILIP